MAKLRKNHEKADAKAGGGMVVKVGVFAAILGGLLWFFGMLGGGETTISDAMDKAEEVLGQTSEENDNSSSNQNGGNDSDFDDEPDIKPNASIYPTSTTGQVISHDFYTLSYSEKHEQAEWVAYQLTRESLQVPNVDRTNNFRPDPKVSKASASKRDYIRTGYEKGHLAPAADMAFSEEAMSESFYMSNMSPQISNFNGGIWRELEETVRDWAYRFGHVYVVTGPVLSRGIRESIGDNKVSVPDLFYKVILDYSGTEHKAIAFLMPNEVSDKPITDFAVSIDQVEEITGIDFFPEIITTNAAEERLERRFNPALWEVNEKRFKLRKEEWNKRR